MLSCSRAASVIMDGFHGGFQTTSTWAEVTSGMAFTLFSTSALGSRRGPHPAPLAATLDRRRKPGETPGTSARPLKA